MADDRILVVGLGNPGAQYAGTRHNIGFMAVDELARRARIDVNREKFSAHYGSGRIATKAVVLLKPLTFMNRSGQSVVAAAQFFKVKPSGIIVIHDELDQQFSQTRLKLGGGHAGHNGLRSIINLTGSKEFIRVRMGIGRPRHGDVSRYVLSGFSSPDETAWLPGFVDDGADAVEYVLREGVQMAMNKVNAPAR